MECKQCVQVFTTIGKAFNSPVSTATVLERVSKTLTEQLGLKGCVFRLLSRDQKVLEDVASYGLSQRFMYKGPVDAEHSMAEALSGELVLVEDCAHDPRIQYPAEHAAEGIVSCLTVPLRTRGQVIGTMRLFAAEPGRFKSQETDIAEVVAAFATRAIVHCMFHSTLDRVADSIRTILDADEVLARVVEVIADELRSKGASVHLYDRRQQKLVLRAHSGLSERYLTEVAPWVVEAVWPKLNDGCVQFYEPGEAGILPNPGAVRREGIGSQLYAPLVARKQLLGVLGVYTHLPYRFSEDELYFMEAIGGQCGLAIENARMYGALQEQYQSLANDFQMWFDRPYAQARESRS